MLKGIVWLASYPKSGNTWFRIFLHNLLFDKEELADLDTIGFQIASDRKTFDDVSGVSSADLGFDEIDRLRPRVYERLVQDAEELPIFMKVHDAYTCLPDGEPLLSAAATAAAIYIVRNPLDVAVSFAHYRGHDGFDATIEAMAEPAFALQHDRRSLPGQLRQRLLSWSGHVRSWVDESHVPVHVMRYEDMASRPQETFGAAARFAGLEHDEHRIARALEAARFDRLKEIEAERGCRETVRRAKSFFREGRAGSWEDELSAGQVERIVADHAELMHRFGYLTDDGRPIRSESAAREEKRRQQ